MTKQLKPKALKIDKCPMLNKHTGVMEGVWLAADPITGDYDYAMTRWLARNPEYTRGADFPESPSEECDVPR